MDEENHLLECARRFDLESLAAIYDRFNDRCIPTRPGCWGMLIWRRNVLRRPFRASCRRCTSDCRIMPSAAATVLRAGRVSRAAAKTPDREYGVVYLFLRAVSSFSAARAA